MTLGSEPNHAQQIPLTADEIEFWEQMEGPGALVNIDVECLLAKLRGLYSDKEKLASDFPEFGTFLKIQDRQEISRMERYLSGYPETIAVFKFEEQGVTKYFFAKTDSGNNYSTLEHNEGRFRFQDGAVIQGITVWRDDKGELTKSVRYYYSNQALEFELSKISASFVDCMYQTDVSPDVSYILDDVKRKALDFLGKEQNGEVFSLDNVRVYKHGRAYCIRLDWTSEEEVPSSVFVYVTLSTASQLEIHNPRLEKFYDLGMRLLEAHDGKLLPGCRSFTREDRESFCRATDEYLQLRKTLINNSRKIDPNVWCYTNPQTEPVSACFAKYNELILGSSVAVIDGYDILSIVRTSRKVLMAISVFERIDEDTNRNIICSKDTQYTFEYGSSAALLIRDFNSPILQDQVIPLLSELAFNEDFSRVLMDSLSYKDGFVSISEIAGKSLVLDALVQDHGVDASPQNFLRVSHLKSGSYEVEIVEHKNPKKLKFIVSRANSGLILCKGTGIDQSEVLQFSLY